MRLELLGDENWALCNNLEQCSSHFVWPCGQAVSQDSSVALGLCPCSDNDAVYDHRDCWSEILKGSLQDGKLQNKRGKATLDSLQVEVLITQKKSVFLWTTLNHLMKPNQRKFICGYQLKSPEFKEVRLPWTAEE